METWKIIFFVVVGTGGYACTGILLFPLPCNTARPQQFSSRAFFSSTFSGLVFAMIALILFKHCFTICAVTAGLLYLFILPFILRKRVKKHLG